MASDVGKFGVAEIDMIPTAKGRESKTPPSLSSSAAGWRAKVSPVPDSGACTPRARVGVGPRIDSLALQASTRF